MRLTSGRTELSSGRTRTRTGPEVAAGPADRTRRVSHRNRRTQRLFPEAFRRRRNSDTPCGAGPMSKGVQTQRGREAAAGRCSRRSPLRRAGGADPSVRAGQSALPARARPGATPVRGRSARRLRPLATGASVPHTRTAFADRANEPTAGEAARAGFSRGRLRPAHVPWARRSLGGQSPRHAAPWVLDLTPLRPVPCWASLGVSAGKTGVTMLSGAEQNRNESCKDSGLRLSVRYFPGTSV